MEVTVLFGPVHSTFNDVSITYVPKKRRPCNDAGVGGVYLVLPASGPRSEVATRRCMFFSENLPCLVAQRRAGDDVKPLSDVSGRRDDSVLTINLSFSISWVDIDTFILFYF